MMSKMGQACPVKSDSWREETCPGVRSCANGAMCREMWQGSKWPHVQRRQTWHRSQRGLPGVGTPVPSAGRRELLRDFPEGSDNGQICSLERSV